MLELFKEAVASAISQKVISALTLFLIAGMVLTVMVTTGKTVAAKEDILASIDSVGTRTITFRVDPESGLDTTVLHRIANISDIEWSGALTAPVDTVNAYSKNNTRVPVRTIFSNHLAELDFVGVDNPTTLTGWASAEAASNLGLIDGSGTVSLEDFGNISVLQAKNLPPYLSKFEPLLLIPEPDLKEPKPISILIVVVEDVRGLTSVVNTVSSVLAVKDSSEVQIETSEILASFQRLLEGQLTSFSQSLLILMLILTGLIEGVLLYGLVMLRRKDFGRRRALGASRALIIKLLLLQTSIVALLGALLGLLIATVVLLLTHELVPGASFMFALLTLTMFVSVVAACVPAAFASRRQPINELRVP